MVVRIKPKYRAFVSHRGLKNPVFERVHFFSCPAQLRDPCAKLRRKADNHGVRGYRDLACIIAIAWDTSFSPVDVRTLLLDIDPQQTMEELDRRDEGRAKISKAANGAISRRTE
jgi:hypothetical protein